MLSYDQELQLLEEKRRDEIYTDFMFLSLGIVILIIDSVIRGFCRERFVGAVVLYLILSAIYLLLKHSIHVCMRRYVRWKHGQEKEPDEWQI